MLMCRFSDPAFRDENAKCAESAQANKRQKAEVVGRLIRNPFWELIPS